MSDLILLYCYYLDERETTYLYEEYRMYEQLARNLKRLIEGMVEE